MDSAWLGRLARLMEIVAASALTILLLVCAAWLIFSTVWLLTNRLPPDIRFRVMRTLFRIQWLPEERASEELVSAERHHQSIGTWVARRIGGRSTDDLPPDIVYKFRLNQRGGAPADIFKPADPTIRMVSNLELRLLMLSLGIFNDRDTYWKRRRRNYRSAQISTWLTISIGLVTTIMVSLGSTDFGKGDEGAAPIIRILAIVLPAVGTASAAIIAFYGFSAEMARCAHTVVSLRQIHSQMALDIWSLEPGTSSDAVLESKLHDWVKRYIDIQAVADAAAPSKDDQTSRLTPPQGAATPKGEAAAPAAQPT